MAPAARAFHLPERPVTFRRRSLGEWDIHIRVVWVYVGLGRRRSGLWLHAAAATFFTPLRSSDQSSLEN
jgi:hypothetical protein